MSIEKKIGTFLLLSLHLIQLQEQYPSCLDPFFTLFLFFSCLSGVKRLVALLLLCRISRTLSLLVCLMMTCTRTQGIRIQADDARIHKRVYRRHCHLCRCCMYIHIYIYMCVCVCIKFHSFSFCNEVWRRDV